MHILKEQLALQMQYYRILNYNAITFEKIHEFSD